MNTFATTKTYTGLEVDLYDDFWHQEELDDLPFFLQMASFQGGRVLDLGCGTGRILVPLVQSGISVTGVDSSPEMLEICRKKLVQKRLDAALVVGDFESFDLGEKFDSVFIPGASFQLLTNRFAVDAALANIARHLVPGGQLILATFIPWEDLREAGGAMQQWRLHREAKLNDGRTAFCHTISDANLYEQQVRIWNRFEVFDEDGEMVSAQMREMDLRWYGGYEMTLLLEKHGFSNVTSFGDFEDEAGADHHQAIAYRALKNE